MATRCQAQARFGSLSGKLGPEQNPAHPCSLGVPACLAGAPNILPLGDTSDYILMKRNAVPCKPQSTAELQEGVPGVTSALRAHLAAPPGRPVEDLPGASAARCGKPGRGPTGAPDPSARAQSSASPDTAPPPPSGETWGCLAPPPALAPRGPAHAHASPAGRASAIPGVTARCQHEAAKAASGGNPVAGTQGSPDSLTR